ncbi:ATP-dependent RNA helicase HrpA [Sideroxydans lithotrophicus]|uniref:ATP-dependent helicase HrpA n=1 Tax=Sideroxydans lithotrophicus (strain ES-1) TaxID=580332 RepID=D5CM72_SIDLE|nr:ATP-dependent RNA helicase HrpA [Sideroxydans lithotrophicus]ADE10686.1 ATP-dependent helicase HrpA [Sideroxydans lithotrophicus ES-1]
MNPALSAIAQRRLARIQQLSEIEYPADLPVVARREELAQAIEKNQVVIVCGETGSGKTTQLPKICLSLGRGVLGVIGHTQPRRVAARSVGARIAHELKSELGGLVGYKVRFNDKVSPDTCIKLMTDGILLAEIHHDPLLKQYDTIIIDEAHERSLNIDFLLGYLRQLLPRRPDLKLIITSATLDADRFAKHFSSAAISPSPSGRGGGVREDYPKIPETLLSNARELRKNSTDAEQLLWQLLRSHQLLDHKFRRQHPLGSYILDFYCHETKLAIELDGGQHAEGAQLKHDEMRSAWLKTQGITVLRFWNNDVLTNTEGVLQTIFDCLSAHSLTPTPDGTTSHPTKPASGQVVGYLPEGEGLKPAPIIQVSGRTYPVEVRYRPPQQNEEGDTQDVPQAVCSALDELSIGGLRGDVLVFLPGEREIRDTAEALRKHQHKGIEILPLFSRLSIAEQDRVFKPASGMRRVVLATNVAETSLTVPNIGYVIDSGLARINRYSVRQKVEQLRIENIARAAANQRAGRCGRVMSGVCIRLYEEADFLQRPEFTDAEIFRVSLATVILRMSALGLGEVEEFPFIEPPGSRAIADGYQLLTELGAIAESVPSPLAPLPKGEGNKLPPPLGEGWGEGAAVVKTAIRQLTPLGHELAKLPLDPKVARLLLAGRQYQCLNEILIIASALALQDPRDRPSDRREAADAAHQRFNDERSDFLAYIKLWAWFQDAIRHKKTNKLWANECREKFLSPLRLREWHELHQQLHAQVSEMGMRFNEQPATYEQIHKALLTGLLGNIGCKGVDKEPYYLGPREIKFFIASNSVLAKKGTKWVVAAEIVETTRLFARCVARIEPEWLEEVGAHLIKRSYFDPHWEKKAGQVAAWERSTLYGLLINPKKRVHYGPMNPQESHEVFIREALVNGEFNTQAPFFAHNQKLIADIEALEHKARRPDVLVDDELIFAFYDARIPAGIHNGAAFEHWRKEAEREQPKLLYLKKDDLMRHEAAGITTEQFPPQLLMNNVSYALAYNFAPGKSDDGVTLTVPQALLNQVSAARCEWLVPGILAEKVVQLVKSLPQKLRRHCVPVPEFAAEFCASVKPSDMPLLQALARYIREQKQLDVPLDAFRLEQLPAHQLMNFRVVDEHGRQLGMSRNFAALRGEWAISLTPALSQRERESGQRTGSSPSPSGRGVGVREELKRHTSWDFGDFKPTRTEPRAGQTVTVFNALVDEGDAVTLQAFDTQDEAKAAHRLGLRRMFMLALKEQVKYLEKNLPGLQAMAMQFLPFGSQQDLQRQILAVTFDRCCLNDPWPESEKEFATRCKEAKARLNLVAQEIARLVGAVLAEYHAMQKSLPGFKAHAQVLQDIRNQCEWLLGKEWVARTPYERMQHMPRYLKAVNVRLEKLRANPARDAQNLAQMGPLLQQWQRKLSAQHGEADARLQDFGWMMQELRVSLFAQELKTPVIVSVKRLEKMLAGLS